VPDQRANLWFLGAANNADGSGTGTITYTDGGTAPFTLALTKWTPSAVLPTDEPVATAPRWNRPQTSGYPADTAVSVHPTRVPPPDASRTDGCVTPPGTVTRTSTSTGDQAGTRLHVFDLAVE
jgi:hypothetical protein